MTDPRIDLIARILKLTEQELVQLDTFLDHELHTRTVSVGLEAIVELCKAQGLRYDTSSEVDGAGVRVFGGWPQGAGDLLDEYPLDYISISDGETLFY